MRRLSVGGVLFLAGCATAIRLQDVGDIPPLTRPQDPTTYPGYQPVHMPMPDPKNQTYKTNSLWRTGARTFFKDQRAHQVGDLVTIQVQLNDNAEINSSTNANRTNKNSVAMPHLLGYENKLEGVLPGVKPSSLLGYESKPNTQSNSKTGRSENVKFSVSATVTQVLPNGNFVVVGRQEMRINFDVREIVITGVVRPEDISSKNEVQLAKIAEARVSYGGRGQTSDLQKIPYGQQVINNMLPF